MAYSTYEIHPYLGYPVELFDFFIEGIHHRYVSHDADVTVDNFLWTAQPISRGSFSKGNELQRSSLEVYTTLDLPVMSKFAGGMPESQVDLWVYRVHLTDPDLEKVQIWTGQITSIKRSDRNLTMKGEVPEVHLKSVGLRRRIQRTCTHPLYGTGCFLNKETFKQMLPVTDVQAGGKLLYVTVADATVFTGGMVSALVDGHWKYRFVSRSGAGTISLAHPAPWITIGSVLTAYPGCNKTLEHCTNRFNNTLNFGGFPHLTSSDLYSTRIY